MAACQRGKTTDAALQVLLTFTTCTLVVLTILEKLRLLHTTPKTSEPVFTMPAFVCRMYNMHKRDSVDATRHMLFSMNSKPEAMSPTSDALHFYF